MNEAQVWRNYSTIAPISETHILFDNKSLTHFCSTSYLALNWNPEIQAKLHAFFSNLQFSKMSSLGSNYLGGTHPSKLEFENIVASQCKFETAIAFSSGWNANYALASYLGQTYDLILSDSKSHNSMIHGLRPYKSKVHVIEVSELTDGDILAFGERRIALIFASIEGISGESPIVNLSESILNQITIVADESHSFGMFGTKGIDPIQNIKIDIRLLGFSKALGNVGALICASTDVKTWVEQNAAIWIFSTPLPPYIWELNQLLFLSMQKLVNERASIFEKSKYLRNRFEEISVKYSGIHHITGLHLPEDLIIDKFEKYLIIQGIFLKVSGFPSVPKGTLISRVTLNPYHTQSDIDHLVFAIQNYLLSNQYLTPTN